ncbi:MAG: class I SAM-dependent rRNA methyltransferase [Bacteroidales bacterium]|nr:class I SAM-dependent rRNA methyltransferase [Bacteroidales bacterium]
MHTLILRRGKADSLRRFHPWLFSGAVFKIICEEEDLQEGDLVRIVDSVKDEEGTHYEFIAIGHYQVGSIAVRVLTFEDEEINSAFWSRRLREAFLVRKRLGLVRQDNTMFRLVHGEGDRLPGLIIDVYGDTAVMQAHSVGMHVSRQEIADALCEATEGLVKNVYYKSETTLPYKAPITGEKEGWLVGHSDVNVAQENGIKFHIDWLEGQKTGFFVDQRDNRALLEEYAHGKNVLNMFCYTGGFSVYALRGGANHVHSVDASARAIELTNANVALNFPDAQHEGYCEDAFKYLERAGGDYDLIVLDPPAFAKHKDALRNALKGYTRLNAIAFKKIRPGGIVFTFSCSQAVNKEQFRLAVFTAAAQSGRHVRILHQLHQPADHPINIYHPEGEYLKGLVLYVE